MSLPYQFKSDPYSSHSAILARVGEANGRRVLDVGAADGYLAERLVQKGFEVLCLEGDQALAATAIAKSLTVIRTDLDEPLPELKGEFDLIVCGDVLEHLKNPSEVLGRLRTILKPDGTMIISVPNVAHAWIRLQLLLGRFEYTDRGILDRAHLHFYTRSSFHRFLRQEGMEIVEFAAVPVPLPLVVPRKLQGRVFNVVHRLNAITARMWSTLFAYQFIAIARKDAAS
jgi:2-polyprenyl-3-methyl-5-hydroxy-6-metoxy-1,4-benzoquinol methylase